MYSAVSILSLPMHLLMDTIWTLLFSFPLRKHLQKAGGKGKQVRKGRRWRPGRKKLETVKQRGRVVRVHCSRSVFKGLAEVTKERSTHQTGRMWEQKQVPELLGSPNWSFLLLGLACRLCRTGGSPTGWQDLGWVQIKSTAWALRKRFQRSQKRGCSLTRLVHMCQALLCTAEAAHVKGH